MRVGIGRAGRGLAAFQFSGRFESTLGQESELFSRAAIQLSGGQKNGIVYSLFCIFINIIVITNRSSSIS